MPLTSCHPKQEDGKGENIRRTVSASAVETVKWRIVFYVLTCDYNGKPKSDYIFRNWNKYTMPTQYNTQDNIPRV